MECAGAYARDKSQLVLLAGSYHGVIPPSSLEVTYCMRVLSAYPQSIAIRHDDKFIRCDSVIKRIKLTLAHARIIFIIPSENEQKVAIKPTISWAIIIVASNIVSASA